MEHIITTLEEIVSNIEFGDITRNNLTDKLNGVISELQEQN